MQNTDLPAVTIVPRTWFNDEANSRWYLVPGLLVIVSAVSASLMGSIVIAREWERGTLTSLFATPASS
ncbi:MAG: ABC transporter permease, partial [Sutterella wadsworthensis]|nr:ABC transporter permease [Sutterella wadsworthensis]